MNLKTPFCLQPTVSSFNATSTRSTPTPCPSGTSSTAGAPRSWRPSIWPKTSYTDRGSQFVTCLSFFLDHNIISTLSQLLGSAIVLQCYSTTVLQCDSAGLMSFFLRIWNFFFPKNLFARYSNPGFFKVWLLHLTPQSKTNCSNWSCLLKAIWTISDSLWISHNFFSFALR